MADVSEVARERWLRSLQRHADELRHDREVVAPVADAADRVLRRTVTGFSPAAPRVRVPRDWEAVVADVEDGELELVVRIMGRDPPEVALHAIGICRVCHATVPLEPPLTAMEDLGAALDYELPAPHECLEHPPVGEE